MLSQKMSQQNVTSPQAPAVPPLSGGRHSLIILVTGQNIE